MDIAYDDETTTAHDDIKEQLFHTTVREQTVSELRLNKIYPGSNFPPENS